MVSALKVILPIAYMYTYMYNYRYMGKNYTLYINQDRFSDEDNKSGLVNRLLEEHYRKGGGGFSEVPKSPPKPKRDPDTFTKLKQKLDVREPVTYKKTGNWGA